MITPTRLTSILLVIVSMTSSSSPLSASSFFHFNNWGFPQNLQDANITNDELSFLEPCDTNPEFPDYEGRFTIPEEFNGKYGMVTYKTFTVNQIRIPTCWVYQDGLMNFDQAKQFCASKGLRLYRPFNDITDRALLKLNRDIPPSSNRYTESWLGIEEDANGTLRWLDGTEVIAGWTRWYNHPTTAVTRMPGVSTGMGHGSGQFRTRWIQKSTSDLVRGTWCEKDFFRIVPCGHCMDRGAGVNFTSTFNCSFSNINFNNRNILTKAGLQSTVLSEMKKSMESAKYVSKIILGYKHKQKDSWVRLATYIPTGTDNDTELNLTTKGSQSFRTITAGGGTIDGELEGNVKSIWLAQTLSDMECNADTSGLLGCWIEYYVEDKSYPRVEQLVDITIPGRIVDVKLSERRSMFDTLNRNVTVTVQTFHDDQSFQFTLVSCNGTLTPFTEHMRTRPLVDMYNDCLPEWRGGHMTWTFQNMYTPDICNISFAATFEIGSGFSNKDGDWLKEGKYITDEVILDVQPDCRSTLKELSTTNPVVISLAIGLAVTFITVLVLLFPQIARWIQAKLQGLDSKKRSNGMSSKAQHSNEDIASSIPTATSDGTTSSSGNIMLLFQGSLGLDGVSRSPSFATQRTHLSGNSKGTRDSKSGKSGISSQKTGTISARSFKFDGSVKEGGSGKSSKRGKKEPARHLGIEDQSKGFIRELSAHALEQMRKNTKGKLS